MSYIEAISLLHLLHKVPAQPSKNWPPITPVFPSESYSLPLEKERSLASGLAFLCGIFLDSFSVPALYIHENVKGESLQVFVAINKRNGNGSDNALQDIKQRLERVLSKLVSSDQENNEDEIMTAVVTMCEEKIKDRLDITKAMDKTFQKLLQIMLGFGNSTKKIKTNTRQLIARINEYKKHQTVQRLVPIVDATKVLSKTANLETHVENIPNNILDPGQRKKICRVARKVAQYRDTARLLYRTAKKFTAARNMEVMAVELPSETFTFEECTNNDLKSTLLRLKVLPKHDKDYHRLTKLIKNQISDGRLMNPQDHFAYWCEKSQRAGKVHSEVQLIAYYEQHRLRPPPRVICASKNACFLCNALIQLHAKFYTPKCHGRLYPGWKLPRSIGLDAQFAHVLEDLACKSVRRTLNQNRLIKHPDPIESSIFSRKSSQTTFLLPEPEAANDTIVTELAPEPQPEISVVELNEEAQIDAHQIKAVEKSEDEKKSSASEVVDKDASSLPRNLRPARLQRGKPYTVTINSGSSIKLCSGMVNLYLEYESKSDTMGVEVQIHWLAEKPPDSTHVIDVRSLRGELSVGSIIYISSGDEYFLIKIQ